MQLNAGARSCQQDVCCFFTQTAICRLMPNGSSNALADPESGDGSTSIRPSVDVGSYHQPIHEPAFPAQPHLDGDQAMFVRRHVFQQLGGFPGIPIMEDIELSARLKRTGRTVALRGFVTTSFRRWERRGPLRTILLMWALRFLYWIGISPHRLARLYADVR